MTGKTESIEVDNATASALTTSAAARGVSVSQLVAELVPLAIDDEAFAGRPHPASQLLAKNRHWRCQRGQELR